LSFLVQSGGQYPIAELTFKLSIWLTRF
jgi:hypothetical protein